MVRCVMCLRYGSISLLQTDCFYSLPFIHRPCLPPRTALHVQRICQNVYSAASVMGCAACLPVQPTAQNTIPIVAPPALKPATVVQPDPAYFDKTPVRRQLPATPPIAAPTVLSSVAAHRILFAVYNSTSSVGPAH